MKSRKPRAPSVVVAAPGGGATEARAAAVRAPLLGAEVAQMLRDEITRLALAPGEKLVVDTIAERFALSRSPVREALQILAGEGLTEHVPRRGMFVTALSVEGLDQLYACRKPLEALAAAGAAEHVTPALSREMARLLARMDVAVAAGRRDASYAANVAFTDLLHAACGNALLARLLHTLDRQALRYRWYCYQEREEKIATDLAANRALAAAIDAGDAAVAGSVTERLLDESWRMIRAALLARPADAPIPRNTGRKP